MAFPFRIYVELGLFRSFSILDVALVFAGLLQIAQLTREPEHFYVGDRLMFLLLIVPAGIALASLSWSAHPAVSVRYVTHSLEAIVAYLAAVTVMRDLPSQSVFHAMAGFVLALFAGSALFYLQVPGFERPVVVAELDPDSVEYLEWVTGFATRLGHPFIGQSNVFATVLVFFVPTFVAYARWADSNAARLMAVLCITGLALTLSRGAALALGLGLMVYAVYVHRVKPTRPLARWLLAGGLGAAALAMAVWIAVRFEELAEVVVESRLDVESFDVRLKTLEIASQKIGERPILGYGAGTAGQLDPELFGGVHNAYLELMISYGVPLGLAASFSLLLMAYAAWRWRAYRGQQVLAVGATAALVALLATFLTQASYESGPLRVLLGFSLGMLVAMFRSACREARAPSGS
jgi:O-antigen ligase